MLFHNQGGNNKQAVELLPGRASLYMEFSQQFDQLYEADFITGTAVLFKAHHQHMGWGLGAGRHRKIFHGALHWQLLILI